MRIWNDEASSDMSHFKNNAVLKLKKVEIGQINIWGEATLVLIPETI